MASNVLHRFPSPFLLCLAWLALGCVLGCARHQPASVTCAPLAGGNSGRPTIKARQAQAAYQQGVAAFADGDLKKAATLWHDCLCKETVPAARQRALFALFAVKLAQADTQADVAMAMNLFETWLKHSPPGGSGEDARFLAPVLRTFRPAFALREARAAGERECAKKLTERTDQIKRMQQQIKALENIHREIQEKKKGLTNY